MSDDLYQQQILDHYQHPHNLGELKDADLVLEESNASCGDNFTFYIKFNNPPPFPKGELRGVVIDKITFTGTGCAISTTACSLLTDKLIGKPVSHINKLNLKFMHKLIGVEVTLLRQKCLMLPVKAVQKIYKQTKD